MGRDWAIQHPNTRLLCSIADASTATPTIGSDGTVLPTASSSTKLSTIEALDEHLATDERSSRKTRKRKEKIRACRHIGVARARFSLKWRIQESCAAADEGPLANIPIEEVTDSPRPVVVELLPKAVDDSATGMKNEASPETKEADSDLESKSEDDAAQTVGGRGNHKSLVLVRKVLPDVTGLFNSHLWSLWSPNV